MLLNLALWSFMIALTPWALELAWLFIIGVRTLLRGEYSQDRDEAGRMGPPYSSSLRLISHPGSKPDRVSCSWH
jgi:hypothetical protein